jgi:hypothetical protein
VQFDGADDGDHSDAVDHWDPSFETSAFNAASASENATS